MRRKVVFDPTAGERARLAQELPEQPQPIVDPTDPRYGLLQPDAGAVTGEPRSYRGSRNDQPKDVAA